MKNKVIADIIMWRVAALFILLFFKDPLMQLHLKDCDSWVMWFIGSVSPSNHSFYTVAILGLSTEGPESPKTYN